jgi:hypothetical protein
VSLETRRERAAGRIADDERLRGRLEDDAFGPLQEWALGWVDAYARATAGLEDAAAEGPLEAGVNWARAQVTALVGLVGEWRKLKPAARAARLSALAPTFPAPGLVSEADSIASLRNAAEAAMAIVAALPVAPG